MLQTCLKPEYTVNFKFLCLIKIYTLDILHTYIELVLSFLHVLPDEIKLLLVVQWLVLDIVLPHPSKVPVDVLHRSVGQEYQLQPQNIGDHRLRVSSPANTCQVDIILEFRIYRIQQHLSRQARNQGRGLTGL